MDEWMGGWVVELGLGLLTAIKNNFLVHLVEFFIPNSA